MSRIALIRATVLDRPGRDGDHLFVAEHQSRQVIGALAADWQRDRERRTACGLAAEWQQDPANAASSAGPRLVGRLEVPEESVSMSGVEFYEVCERPMFVVEEVARFPLGPDHGDDALVEAVRTWYQAAWNVVAMSQFIGQVADLREAMRQTGQQDTQDFHDIEVELSQARMEITKARSILAARTHATTGERGTSPSGEADGGAQVGEGDR